MLNFTWNIDPVAFSIPRGPLLLVLGALALSMLIGGIMKKQSDMSLFGLVVGALVAILSNYLPESLGIRYYSLLFVGVFLGGYSLLDWQIRRAGGSVDAAGEFIIYGVLGVLVGARLGHVIFYDWEKALDDPLWIIKIWTGGLASHGAVVGLIVAMYLYCKKFKVPFLEGADRFAFSAALGATLVRIGNFFNSEILGREVPNQTWGVRFVQAEGEMAPLRFPTQLFEAFLGIFVLFVLFIVDRAAGKEKRPRGLLISVFFVVYFIGRFIVEFWKEHQTEAPTPYITMGQYLSLPGIALGLYGISRAYRLLEPAAWPLAAATTGSSTQSTTAEPEAEEEDDEDEDEEQAESPTGGSDLSDPDVDAEFEKKA